MADGSSPVLDEPVATRSRPAPPPAASRFSTRTLLLIGGVVVLVVGGAWLYFTGGRYIDTDNAYVESNLVQLTASVSGTVSEIDVKENQAVQPGQVMFKLDVSAFQAALDNAKAQLALAMNQVEVMKANYREKQQELKQSAVNLDFAQRDWNRKSSLFHQHVIPQSAMDQSQQALDTARQQVQTQQQQLASLVAELGGDPDIAPAQHPRVLAAKAEVDTAQIHVNDTIVKAPVPGIVTNVPSLQLGRYLPASTAAFGLVETDDVWVTANPKETELTWVRPGQPVTVTVDTYPGVQWQGSVASLSPASGSQFSLLPAQNTSGNWVKVVQRIPIRIAVKPDASKPPLRDGMSVEINIDTGHRRTLGGLLSSIGL